VKTNHCLVLNGTNACLEIEREQIDFPDGPFTVEAWVKPSLDTNGAILSNLKVGGFSLEVAGVPQFRVQTDGREVNDRRWGEIAAPIVIRAQDRLTAGVWTHLAGVFDGREISLFVNGRKAASTNTAGARLSSDKSLFVGARPNAAWNTHNVSHPMLYYRGAVDDVRVSRAARYSGRFTPSRHLARDASTAFVLANDRCFGPFVPDETGPSVQAVTRENVSFAPAER
jgi:hypothetical protein